MAKATLGRPRSGQQWESTMKYAFSISYASHKDVHTALQMAGPDVVDFLLDAVREYIINHDLPAGRQDVQNNAALVALGLATQHVVTAPPPRDAPLPRPAPRAESVSLVDQALPTAAALQAIQPNPQHQVLSGVFQPQIAGALPMMMTADSSLKNFARSQLEDS